MGWGSCGGDDTRDPFIDCTPALDDGGVGRALLSAGGDSYFVRDAFILVAPSTKGLEGKRASSCCSETVTKCGKIA